MGISSSAATTCYLRAVHQKRRTFLSWIKGTIVNRVLILGHQHWLLMTISPIAYSVQTKLINHKGFIFLLNIILFELALFCSTTSRTWRCYWTGDHEICCVILLNNAFALDLLKRCPLPSGTHPTKQCDQSRCFVEENEGFPICCCDTLYTSVLHPRLIAYKSKIMFGLLFLSKEWKQLFLRPNC